MSSRHVRRIVIPRGSRVARRPDRAVNVPEALPVLIGAVALAALVQGFGGFGFGIVAMSVAGLTSVALEPAAAVFNCVALAVVLVLLRVSRRQGVIWWKEAILLLVGSFAGQPFGYAFILRTGDQPVFRLALGLFLLAAGVHGLTARSQRRPWPRWTALPVGLFSGFLSGAFSTGGPPLILFLYSRAADARTMKATIQFIFAATLASRLLLIQFEGSGLTRATGLAAAACAPVAFALMALGHRLSLRVTPRRFTQCVYAAIALLGASIAIRAAVVWGPL
jgi:uncharacterized membrane protein YfcA